MLLEKYNKVQAEDCQPLTVIFKVAPLCFNYSFTVIFFCSFLVIKPDTHKVKVIVEGCQSKKGFLFVNTFSKQYTSVSYLFYNFQIMHVFVLVCNKTSQLKQLKFAVVQNSRGRNIFLTSYILGIAYVKKHLHQHHQTNVITVDRVKHSSTFRGYCSNPKIKL